MRNFRKQIPPLGPSRLHPSGYAVASPALGRDGIPTGLPRPGRRHAISDFVFSTHPHRRFLGIGASRAAERRQMPSLGREPQDWG